MSRALRSENDEATITRERKKFRNRLDLSDPKVQTYIAGLLVDPDFEDLVKDLGRFYDRLKDSLPNSDLATTHVHNTNVTSRFNNDTASS